MPFLTPIFVYKCQKIPTFGQLTNRLRTMSSFFEYPFSRKISGAIYIIGVCFLLSAGASILVTSCSPGGSYPPVEIGRLDLALQADSLPGDVRLGDAAAVLFAVSGYGALTDSSLHAYNRNPSIRIHDRAMDSLWSDLRPVEADLGRMKFNFARLFPADRFPAVFAIVSPFNQSVFTADTLMFVGLNHYLGADYAPYAYFPDYLRVRKTPARLLPDMAETLVRGLYPYRDESDGYSTVLSRLLYEGAVVESVMQLCGLSEQQVLGYDDEAMAWASENEKRVWETMAERKMIFAVDPQLAAMLVSPAPFTSAINPNSPGAIGRFIGHRIITAYLDRRATSLSELLSPDFYTSQNSLFESGY